MNKGIKYAAAAVGAYLLFFSRKTPSMKGFPIQEKYTPNSPEAVALFTEAAKYAGLPESWGSNKGLHYILGKESRGGWVGIPNYLFNHLFGKGFALPGRRSEWHKAHKIISLDENLSQARKRHPKFESRASGLGQLQPAHIKSYYPDKFQGIGDPLNEAVGMLKYIRSRYGSPDVARSEYGKGGDIKKGLGAPYVHAVTGKKRLKGFKEGY